MIRSVMCLSQNPTDWKHVDEYSPEEAMIGVDFSGEIVQIGPNQTTRRRVGDKGSGITHGSLYADRGAFAEYTKAYSQLLFLVPDTLSMPEASTFGIPWTTALQAIVHEQKHEWPPAKVDSDTWVRLLFASFAADDSTLFTADRHLSAYLRSRLPKCLDTKPSQSALHTTSTW